MASDNSNKINKGIKTPALGDAEFRKNLGNLPPTKTVSTISKECRPPASPPKGIVGKSTRV